MPHMEPAIKVPAANLYRSGGETRRDEGEIGGGGASLPSLG